jgi:hypothetical protein
LRFLLTSAGIKNTSIHDALVDCGHGVHSRLRQCSAVTPERTLCEDCRVLREVVAE